MNLTELRAEVYTITNRPDLVAQTTTAIRSATLKLHQSDYFFKDLFETGLSFPTSTYEQDFEYRTLIPRFRAIKYARLWDNVGSVAGEFFEIIPPENVLDGYNLSRIQIAYAAGEIIHFKGRANFQHLLFGCYLNPDIAVSTYSSWIALDHPYAIVVEAASKVFKMIGKDDEAAMYARLTLEQLVELKMSNIQAVGY